MDDHAIDWPLFLGRRPGLRDPERDDAFVRGKRVLITGAGGSIGSGLALRLADAGVDRLVLLDVAEGGLFEVASRLEERVPSAPQMASIVGDVCDTSLLRDAFAEHRPHVVFHAAACKHVSLMESNPLAAARTNILGTHRVLRAASEARVGQTIVVSTDKAVDPVGIMGATKRAGELIVLASTGAMRVKAVRLANVLGSSGSAVPVFLRQIARGGPLTITDPACMRYFISMDEAVQHLVSALAVAPSSTVLVPGSGEPLSVLALAEFLMSRGNRAEGKPETVFTGLRPGEKLTEQMTSTEETLLPTNLPHLQQAIPRDPVNAFRLAASIEQIEAAVERRDIERLIGTIIELIPAYKPSRLVQQNAGSAKAMP